MKPDRACSFSKGGRLSNPVGSGVLLQPGDIGGLALAATWGLHDDRDRSLADHLGQSVGLHLTLAEVGVPVRS